MKKLFAIILILVSIVVKAQEQEIYEHHITASTSYNGTFPKATLLIDDANGDEQITNPLIVAEGFDAGSITDPELQYGDTDISSFIGDIDDSQSAALEDLLTGGTELTFGDQDYDIIYVNWDNGVADMRDKKVRSSQYAKQSNLKYTL